MKRLIQLTFWLPLTAVILAATMLPQTATAEKKVRYVKATGTGDGSSWDNASNDLQKMINESDPNSDDEIWVFAGTYKPIHTASGWRYDPNDNANNNFPAADGGRDNAFVLKAGVKIYGGFNVEVMGETTAPKFGETGRTGESTLSGDLDNVNGLSNGDAYHVVISANISNDKKTVLDGFTITGGNANVDGSIQINNQTTTINRNGGGGIYNMNASPVLTNLIISGNYAKYYGGGIYIRDTSFPDLEDVTISKNTACDGGGIAIRSSSPVMENVTVSENKAIRLLTFLGQGGGIFNADESAPVLTNVTICKNESEDYGGGIVNYNITTPSSNTYIPKLNDVTISENKAIYGGGMYNQSSSPVLNGGTISKNEAIARGGGIYNGRYNNNYPPAAPVLTRVTISENKATGGPGETGIGGGIFNLGSSATLNNVIICGNSASESGGGIANSRGGAANPSSSLTLFNVLISGNAAKFGGGIENAGSTAELTNVTISGNSASTNGGGIRLYEVESSSPLSLTNTIVWGNSGTNIYNSGSHTSTSTYTHSLVQGMDLTNSGTGNLDGKSTANNPQFMQPQLPSSAPTIDGDYRLQTISPAFDKGDNKAYMKARNINDISSESELDLDGKPRLINNVIDLGAYECIPSYGISLDPTGVYTFNATYGGSPPSQTVTVKNIGNTPTGALIVGLSGTNAGSFVVTDNHAAQGITAHDSTATFTVAPKAGLNAGTYTATVTVSNNNINSNNQFGVSFKVDKANPKATDLVYELKDTIYNGKPYSVTVTVKPDLIGFDTIIAIKYNGSTALPITVGQYDVTADIAAGQNYNAITDLPLGKFEIKKATPSPNHFDFDLGPINILGTDGTRHGITTPTLKSPYEGMGDITVKYDYDVLRPMGLGSFLVTLNITEGKNFVAIDSLVLGYFVINSLPSYSVVREVHLPDVDGVNTNKAPGRHFINHGSPFEFIIYASTATAAHAPVVTTNRPDDETKVIVTLNPDGNYSVAILDVTETIVIAIDVSGVDAIIGADAATVWSSGGALYITASRPGQAAVYTAAGVRVKTFTLAAGETVVDTTLAAGFYIVELEGQNSKVLISR